MKYLAKVSDREFNITLQNRGDKLEVAIEGETIPVELTKIGGTNIYSLLINNRSFEVEISNNESGYIIHHQGNSYKCYVEEERLAQLSHSLKKKSKSYSINEIKSPMPGLVVSIEVEVGQQVKRGQGVIIIEAMKMENEIKAPIDAVVKEILVKPRQAVEMNQTLLVLE